MLAELWADLRYRLRALFRRTDVEHELDQELAFHVDQATAKHLAAGLAPGEARRRALIEFGGVENTKEESRDRRGTALLESFLADLRYTLRGLRAHPGFTAGVVVTLALGIGANAAMFGVLDRLFFRPPAYLTDASRVHRIYEASTADRQRRTTGNFSMARLLDLRRVTRAFASISGFNTWFLAVGDGDQIRQVNVAAVSASYFGLFNAAPVLGRFFTEPEDTLPGGGQVVVISNAYWKTVYGGRPDVLGQSIPFGRGSFTIIGVTPENFVGIDQTRAPALYIPLTTCAALLRPRLDHAHDYTWRWIQLVAKPAPGVSATAAQTDLTQALVSSRLGEQPANPAWPQQVTAEHRQAVLAPVQLDRGPQAGPEAAVILWVSGVALIVMLIACANVANLLLARALNRRREMALRLALGVSRARLARQLLTESLVLALLGGGLGLVVAQWGGSVFRNLFLAGWAGPTGIGDLRTQMMAFAATLVAALATGLAPVMHTLRHDLGDSLNAGARDSGARPSRLRPALLVFQTALSVVLLVGAGLFVRSLVNVRGLRLGYDIDPLLVVAINRRPDKPVTPQESQLLEAQLSQAVPDLPGGVAATPALTVPFWYADTPPLFVAGIDSVSVLGNFEQQVGNLDYFRTTGTRILRGRAFDTGDRADAPKVVVVSDGMAKALWPGQDALGKCIRVGADTMPCSTVVGVAEDLHAFSFSDAREFSYYVPVAQYGRPTGMLMVRVAGDAGAAVEPMRRQLQALIPGRSFLQVQTLKSLVASQMESWEMGATMFVAFGGLALLLASVGLYSVIAYSVAQRRRELGVRLALGAQPRQVIRLVLRGALRLVSGGVVLGSAIALVAGRWIAHLLFQERVADPVVFGAMALLLVVVAVAATAFPAFAAARVDPNVALRAD